MGNIIKYGNKMNEKEIIRKLKNSLDDLISIPGLKFAFISPRDSRCDLIAKFSFKGLRFNLIIEAVSISSLPVFQNKINRLKSSTIKDSEVPVLVAPYIGPQKQDLCRDNGICFMDLSGNIFISYQSFYIEKTGFPNIFPEKRQQRGPFSDKASLILREFLKNGDRLWGIREIAQKTGLNPGYVSRMGKSLEESGYLVRIDRKLKIQSRQELLDDWVRAYDLKKNELKPFFVMASSVKSIIQRLSAMRIPKDIRYALSVQAGASLVAPHAVFKEVHMYLENSQGIDFFENELELTETDQGSNLVLMLPYYKHSVFYDSREINGLPVVSDIQLYLDLYKYPVRGQEQAEYLFEKKLKSTFSGNDHE